MMLIFNEAARGLTHVIAERRKAALPKGAYMKPSITARQFDSLPMLIDAKQVGALLGMHPRTVQLKAREGEMPGRKIGNKWRFNKKQIAKIAGLDC